MNDRERIAYHEAGHAVFAHYAYPGGKKVTLKSVTIKPDGKTAGLTVARGVSAAEADILLYEAQFSCAGMAAEKIHFNDAPWETEAGGYIRDIIQGQAAIEGYVLALFGELNEDYEEQWQKITFQIAETVLRHYWAAVEALALALLERETLTGKEAMAIIKAATNGNGKK